MARRRNSIKILGRSFSWTQVAIGAVGLAGLYYILSNRDTGIPFVDQVLEPVGDITGLEGRGQGFAPSIFGSAPPIEAPVAAGPTSGWGDWRFTNAYAAYDYPDEMRFSNAYKNE